ncbi:hypothetical protein [Sediminicoccus sp. KRV36]|uniref:hypothetical protein n=1 Tax=Sediminicoccus sp. KRV36 TaxID=3133721 RepID=UPI00200D93E6|nr:hypothetical protein [Sediminicoccus rosea]UPY35512.1 hypothetical protein LHU95_14935 [Sediminicoccus rosea]
MDERALLRELIEETRRMRLMLARAMAMQMSLSRPMTREQAEAIEARLMKLDQPR